jgi:hypothetical protein
MTGLDEQTLGTLLKEAVPEPGTVPDLADRARDLAARNRRTRVLVGSVVVVLVAALVPALALSLRSGGAAQVGPTDSPTHTIPTPDSALCGRACDPARVAQQVRRPLHLPTVAPGAACPISPRRNFPGGAGFTGPFPAIGTGPLYAAGLTPAGRLPVTPAGAGRLTAKVIWVFAKGYGGPILLRGDRIDGPGRLRFEHYLGAANYPGSGPGTGPHRQVLYVRGGLHASAPDALESEPDVLYVDGPGCYAVQADGVGLSQVLVFRVPAR